MVEKGCLPYLAFVQDTSVDTSSLESVPILREIPNMFPTDNHGIPLDRDIDFGIDLEPGTKPISIPPYRMAPAELKDLTNQL